MCLLGSQVQRLAPLFLPVIGALAGVVFRVPRAGARRRPKPWRDLRHRVRSKKLQVVAKFRPNLEADGTQEERTHLSALRFEADYEAPAREGRFLRRAGAEIEGTAPELKGPGQKYEVRDG